MPSGSPFRNPHLLENFLGGAGLFLCRARGVKARSWLEWGLWTLALAVASVLGWVTIDREIHDRQQASQLSELMTSASRVPPAGVPTARSQPREGALVGRLVAPRIGLTELVSQGVSARTLRRGVGHIPGTALPGEPGNVGLAGHRDTVFRRLRDVEVGDELVLITAAGRVEYRVESLSTVSPERVDVLSPSAHPVLTLVTCFPFDFIGSAPLRFIVRARQVERGEDKNPPVGDRLRNRLRRGER